MVFWLKTGLWVAAAVLPGGLLLLPVIYAVRRQTQPPAAPRDVTVSATS